MLYLRLDDGNMQYHCKSCSHLSDLQDDADLEPTSSTTCVIDNNYDDDFHKQYITPYIAYDPTLPRSSEIACINKQCLRTPDKPNDVRYVKVNANDMRYLYSCSHCGYFWTTKQSS